MTEERRLADQQRRLYHEFLDDADDMRTPDYFAGYYDGLGVGLAALPQPATEPALDAGQLRQEIAGFLSEVDAYVGADGWMQCLRCGGIDSHKPDCAAQPSAEVERLRAAAQAIVSEAEPDDDFDGEFIDYLVPFAAVDALRAALAGSES